MPRLWCPWTVDSKGTFTGIKSGKQWSSIVGTVEFTHYFWLPAILHHWCLRMDLHTQTYGNMNCTSNYIVKDRNRIGLIKPGESSRHKATAIRQHRVKAPWNALGVQRTPWHAETQRNYHCDDGQKSCLVHSPFSLKCRYPCNRRKQDVDSPAVCRIGNDF